MLFDYNFDIEVTDINGEQYKAIFTDLDIGEQFYVDTAEFQASWYPAIVVAIKVAQHGKNGQLKNMGKRLQEKHYQK